VRYFNREVMSQYAAEEELMVRERQARQDAGFTYVILRPGGLVGEEPGGKVVLVKARASGCSSEIVGYWGWVNMLEARETGEGVKRFVEQSENEMEGESFEEMEARVGSKKE
jgi:hypothetical protein